MSLKYARYVFVSNYINHHQIPFCDAMYKLLKGDFLFIQTEPMEEERVQMGWQKEETRPYVKYYYKQPEECQSQIDHCEVLLFGGADEEHYLQNRLRERRLIIRYHERMYKTGQWKAISPRGLVKKYQNHTRYRKAPVYLLCAGAYVPSDYHIIRAYPNKMFCWGYFPETRHYNIDNLLMNKGYQVTGQETKVPYLLWAGRFIDWKHTERALLTAARLRDRGLVFHMDMIGGGPLERQVREQLHQLQLEDVVCLTGFRTPQEVRRCMEQADIYLLTSDRQEGWGAVANEAMNSGCALIADHMTGAAPYLIVQGWNGYVYEDGKDEMLFQRAEQLLQDREARQSIARNAYRTITEVWNAEYAAEELVRLAQQLQNGAYLRDVEDSLRTKQTKRVASDALPLRFRPCAPAPVISEKGMFSVLTSEF